ncbi:MAG: hypothetical protein DRO52_00325 [Candidatus Hecatellales archaeon]|nr:MAG: hypothetical protein DRO52_00325 [Candidatus Hecatellales archaeon]
MKKLFLAGIVAVVLVAIIAAAASLPYGEKFSGEEENYSKELIDILAEAIGYRGKFKYLVEEEPTYSVFSRPEIAAGFKKSFQALIERYEKLTPPNTSYQQLHEYVGEYLKYNLRGFEAWEKAVSQQDFTILPEAFNYFKQADSLRDPIKKELKELHLEEALK